MTTPILKIEPEVNPYLKPGDERLNIAFFVTPEGFDANSIVQPERFNALDLDVSTSMSGAKIRATVEGGLAWLDALPPNDYFAVYAFGARGTRLYPRSGKPTKATPEAVAAAKKVVSQLQASENDTNISLGMRLFREDFLSLPVTEGRLGLLTDGQNAVNDEYRVEDELKSYDGLRKQGKILQIFARGVGTDWNVDQLRKLTDRTLSPPPAVLNPAELRADFEALAKASANQALSDVKMVIKKAGMVPILECAVRAPVNIDLMGAIHAVNEQVTEIPLGSLDNETRLFYLALGVKQPANGGALMACTIHFEYKCGAQVVQTTPTPYPARWTADQSLSKRIPRGVKVAEGIEGSKRKIRDAVQSAQSGDVSGAEATLGELIRIAHEENDGELLAQLSEYVDVIDAATGKVKLKGTDKATLMKLDSGSSVRRVRRGGDAPAAPASDTPANPQ